MTLESLGSLTLKGRAETVAAYRVTSLEPPAGITAAPFVGGRLDAAPFEPGLAAPGDALHVDQLGDQVVERRLVEAELALQGAQRDAAVLLGEGAGAADAVEKAHRIAAGP